MRTPPRGQSGKRDPEGLWSSQPSPELASREAALPFALGLLLSRYNHGAFQIDSKARRSQPSPRSSNQKQRWSESRRGGERSEDPRIALIAAAPPQNPPATWSVSTLWAHQRRAMTSPHRSQASHIIITAHCSEQEAVPSHTRLAIHKPSNNSLVNYYENLLDIMGIQISCVFTAYKKFQTPKEMMRADQKFDSFTTIRKKKKRRQGEARTLHCWLDWKMNVKLQQNHAGAPNHPTAAWSISIQTEKTLSHTHTHYTFIEKHEVVKWLKNTINN